MKPKHFDSPSKNEAKTFLFIVIEKQLTNSIHICYRISSKDMQLFQISKVTFTFIYGLKGVDSNSISPFSLLIFWLYWCNDLTLFELSLNCLK
jgi:hypothetical protein